MEQVLRQFNSIIPIALVRDLSLILRTELSSRTRLSHSALRSTNRRFTSYDRSTATGLDYAVNRHYDSQQGRFTQVDPVGMKAVSPENPQSLNLYSYCGNDPVNRIDPNGLFSWFKALLGFLALGPG